MAIFDRAGAAERVGRDLRTIRRWESHGWLTFTLDRVRESDLLDAERTARENMRRGGRRKGQMMNKPIDLGDETLWPEGAVADDRAYSLEITRRMSFNPEKGVRWFAGEDIDPWEPCEPDLVEPPFEVETMTGTYVDVARRAAHLNMRLDRTGIKAFLYFPHPIEALPSR